ncbi:Long chain acyl-CoA synthetase 2, partial [Bienertia sinuspersici]
MMHFQAHTWRNLYKGEYLVLWLSQEARFKSEVLIDGWFHTGDIGEWQPDGSMKVIDRKKNIFKLSQGEYVAVENLESIYSRCNLITSIWVYGNSFESFLVAVAVPERKALENWAADNHDTGDFGNSLQECQGSEIFPGRLNRLRDLMTPTFKLKRPQLLKHYK